MPENITKSIVEADVSVIVPVYNVEEFLRPCLDSLLKQGDIRLEVICVDDGSTDSSGSIADEYAVKYENFISLHKPNGGLGSARNHGTAYAHGKYLAFLDSDDVLTEGIYERMFKTAEHNGTDLTICNVARFNSQKTWISDLHARVFKQFEPVSHITKNHALIYNTISCDKLILRSFYQKNGFSFPEGILYEDIPVIIPMHILCNGVSMVAEPGYLWRVREGNNKSITQRASATQNLMDRLKVLRMVDRFFDENVKDPELHVAKQKKTLDVDLKIFTNTCDRMSREQAVEMFKEVNAYIDEAIDSDTFRLISILDQQKYEYVRNLDVDSYIRLMEFQKNGYQQMPVTETESGLTVELPNDLFTVPGRDMTAELASYERRVYVDRLTANDDGFDIHGHIYIRRYNIDEEGKQKVSIELINEEQGIRLPLDTVPEKVEFLTDNFGKVVNSLTGEITQYNYDWSGFKAKLDMSMLAECGCPGGVYTVLVKYDDGLANGCQILSGVSGENRAKWQSLRRFSGDVSAAVDFGRLSQLRFLIDSDTLVEEAISVNDGSVTCVLNRDVPHLCAVNNRPQEMSETTMFTGTGNHAFSLALDRLKTDEGYLLMYRKKEDGPDINVYSRSHDVEIHADNECVLLISCVRTSKPLLFRFDHVTKVTSSRKEKGTLYLDTELLGNTEQFRDIEKADVCVYDEQTESDTILAESPVSGENGHLTCHFRVDFVDRKVTENFYAGKRELKIRYITKQGEVLEDRLCCEYGMAHTFIVRFSTLKILCFRNMYGRVSLELRQQWPEEESSANKREALIVKNYPKYLTEPIKKKRIMFESMWGTKYSCNPQALYEYIDEHHPEYECIWSFTDALTPIKGNGIRVRKGSQKYYRYLATSKYLVNNVNFEDRFVKREGQIEIQTMHGTPLKTLGLDVQGDFPTEESRKKFIAKNSNWDYLLVQGKFMVGKSESCYGVKVPAVTAGYPRTDKLFNVTDEQKNVIREKIGIPEGKKVILYTPTWRTKNRFDMKLDLDKMRDAFSNEYVLLIRLHHLAAQCDFTADGKFLFNLTNYQYVEDLYLISDVLITDYSSVMFDFALLNKPMIFFTYDLKDYEEKLRGLYVDFVKEAPGPMVFTTEQVIAAIRHPLLNRLKYGMRIWKFNRKYLTYENGASSERIMREIFGEEPTGSDKANS